MDTIESVMAKKVVTVEMDDSLQTIRDIFQRVEFHHLLVVNGRQIMGLITDRDLLQALSPFLGTISETERDHATLKKPAHQIMQRNLKTIHKQAPLDQAACLLIDRNQSCLPVVDAEGNLEGLVTWKDLLRGLIEEKLSMLESHDVSASS